MSLSAEIKDFISGYQASRTAAMAAAQQQIANERAKSLEEHQREMERQGQERLDAKGGKGGKSKVDPEATNAKGVLDNIQKDAGTTPTAKATDQGTLPAAPVQAPSDGGAAPADDAGYDPDAALSPQYLPAVPYQTAAAGALVQKAAGGAPVGHGSGIGQDTRYGVPVTAVPAIPVQAAPAAVPVAAPVARGVPAAPTAVAPPGGPAAGGPALPVPPQPAATPVAPLDPITSQPLPPPQSAPQSAPQIPTAPTPPAVKQMITATATPAPPSPISEAHIQTINDVAKAAVASVTPQKLADAHPMTLKEYQDVLTHVDPNGEMPAFLKDANALASAYTYFHTHGQDDKAQLVAAQIMKANLKGTQTLGALALHAYQNGDIANASRLFTDAYSKFPGGHELSVVPDPTYGAMFVLSENGKEVGREPASLDMLYQGIKGVKDGSLYLQEMERVAHGGGIAAGPPVAGSGTGRDARHVALQGGDAPVHGGTPAKGTAPAAPPQSGGGQAIPLSPEARAAILKTTEGQVDLKGAPLVPVAPGARTGPNAGSRGAGAEPLAPAAPGQTTANRPPSSLRAMTAQELAIAKAQLANGISRAQIEEQAQKYGLSMQGL